MKMLIWRTGKTKACTFKDFYWRDNGSSLKIFKMSFFFFSLVFWRFLLLVSITDSVASAVFQTMLTVCHRKRPKLCKQLIKRIVEFLTSCSAAPGTRSGFDFLFLFAQQKEEGGAISHFALFCFARFVSPLLVFLKDQASSHLLETILQLSPKSLLRELYKQHLKGHLVGLALHPIANFPVQRLTAASAKCKMVGFK